MHDGQTTDVRHDGRADKHHFSSFAADGGTCVRIEVLAFAGEWMPERLAGKTAIVIDVLRATSTIAAALAAGAAAVVPAESPAEAAAMRRGGDLLAGERYGRRIEGFDLGNSPADYDDGKATGRRIVLSTTNGTRTIRRAVSARRVYTGSLLNAGACAEAAAAAGDDVVLLPAGARGTFAREDGLCAGLIADRLIRLAGRGTRMDDLAAMLAEWWRRSPEPPEEHLRLGASGRRLRQLGCEDDIVRCAQVDRLRIVPAYAGGEIAPLVLADRS